MCASPAFPVNPGRLAPGAFEKPPHDPADPLLCLSADSRDRVDTIVDTAAASGGSRDPNALQDYGFMYCRSVEDTHGHIWKIMWMDPAAAGKGAEAFDARTA